MKYTKIFYTQILSVCLLLCSVNIYGQGIGNNLAFQGLTNQKVTSGVKARAMGNAYTAVSGDINAIFYNPAGLSGIEGIQFSFSGRSGNAKTFERQQFIPVGGAYGIMELIWAGIYTPQLVDDGIRSDKIKYDQADFTEPDSEVNYFEESFADWVGKNKSSGFNNLMLAFPLNVLDRQFVASASYTNSSIYDLDRNEHLLGTDYGAGRVIWDSTWYVYNRQRTGKMNTYTGALASKIHDNLDVGLSFEYMSANTEDDLSNEAFAHFQILEAQNLNRELPENTYYFWHDSTTHGISGKSKFSSLKFSVGAIYKSDRITFGARINLPYTLQRTYDYQEYIITKSLRDSTVAPVTAQGDLIKSTSKFNAPFSFAFGFSIKPTDFVRFAFDYKINPFSRGSYKHTTFDYDTTLSKSKPSKWELPDLNSFNAGLEITPIKHVSLLAGFSNQTEALRPEDHFKAEKIGPKSRTYSLGLSIRASYVVLDFAYEWKQWNYIDYYSFHTDYITWNYTNFLAGMTIKL